MRWSDPGETIPFLIMLSPIFLCGAVFAMIFFAPGMARKDIGDSDLRGSLVLGASQVVVKILLAVPVALLAVPMYSKEPVSGECLAALSLIFLGFHYRDVIDLNRGEHRLELGIVLPFYQKIRKGPFRLAWEQSRQRHYELRLPGSYGHLTIMGQRATAEQLDQRAAEWVSRYPGVFVYEGLT